MSLILEDLPRISIFACFVLGSIAPSIAAEVTWDPPRPISSVTDVEATGTFERACNYNGADTQINGVPFSGVARDSDSSLTCGSTTIMTSEPHKMNGYEPSVAQGALKELPPEYQALLSGQIYAFDNALFLLNLGGLTAGKKYRIQLWAQMDARPEPGQQTITGGSSASASWSPNVTNTEGGAGQFIVGRFTADSDSQEFIIEDSNGGAVVLNGFSLFIEP